MDMNKIEGAIEAILFAVGEEVSASKLSQVLELSVEDIKVIVGHISEKYEKEKSGMRILEINDSYQLCTSSDYFEFIAKMVKAPQRKALTQSLLETLSIIVYKQPITKGQIEEIRGVNSDHGVNRLIELGLIIEAGRADTIGRPILLKTSNEFLKYFGFKNLNDLPILPEYSEDDL
ncbi:MAG: SMC-Scp complex subunit ScpB [Defluviitaleaceae bacterium]|nr:SMC-Scp complex subunit ScpB [Defluviitaleaceae bacterium]